MEWFLKLISITIFFLFLVFFKHADGLCIDKTILKGYICVAVMGLFFLGANEYFMFCILLFHTYTDERQQMAYTLPSVFAGIVEVIIWIWNGIRVEPALELVMSIFVVFIMTKIKVFAEGDGYYFVVLLIGACAMSRSTGEALMVIFYIAAICFIARMAIINIWRLKKKEKPVRQAAFMGSILGGYIGYVYLYLGL